MKKLNKEELEIAIQVFDPEFDKIDELLFLCDKIAKRYYSKSYFIKNGKTVYLKELSKEESNTGYYRIIVKIGKLYDLIIQVDLDPIEIIGIKKSFFLKSFFENIFATILKELNNRVMLLSRYGFNKIGKNIKETS